MNRYRVVSIALLASANLMVPATARGGGTAGSANPGAGGSASTGLSSSTTACVNNCSAQAGACGRSAAGLKDTHARNERMQACNLEATRCTMGCNPSQASSPAAGAGAPTPAMPNAGYDGAANAGAMNDATMQSADDSDATMNQLIASFQQRDGMRVNAADQATSQAIRNFLDVLCHTAGAPSGCTTRPTTGQLSLPPGARLPDRRVTSRFSKGAPPPALPSSGSAGTPAPGMPATPAAGTPASPAPRNKSGSGKKRPGGCYVEDSFVVVGMFSPDLRNRSSIEAGFDTSRGGRLVLKNTGAKPAWFGTPVPINDVIPPRAGYDGNPPVVRDFAFYRTKSDQSLSKLEIVVKFWTDDEDDCASGAVQPGFTTPEEWGPPYTGKPQEIQ